MRKRRIDLKIPYGIMDFRRLRREGYYYVDKTEYLAQMEARDSCITVQWPEDVQLRTCG